MVRLSTPSDDFILLITDAFFSVLQRFVTWLLSFFLGGLIRMLEWLLSGGINERLLQVMHPDDFANPASATHFPGLNDIYMSVSVIFWSLLAAFIILSAVTRMVFPSSDRATITTLGSRTLVAIVLVVFGQILWYQIFEVYNAVGHVIWEAGGGSGMNMELDWFEEGFVDGLRDTAYGITLVIAAFLFFLFIGSALIFTLVIFWTILSIRLVFINTVFVLHPLFQLLWIPQDGIGRYTNQIVSLGYSTAAIMLFLGILIGGLLSVGGALADTSSSLTASPADNIEMTEEPPESEHNFDFGDEPRSVDADGEMAAGSAANFLVDSLTDVIFTVSVWLGTMWACIAGIVGVFGRFASSAGGGGGGGGSSSKSSSEPASNDQENTSLMKSAGGKVREGIGGAIGSVGGYLSGSSGGNNGSSDGGIKNPSVATDGIPQNSGETILQNNKSVGTGPFVNPSTTDSSGNNSSSSSGSNSPAAQATTIPSSGTGNSSPGTQSSSETGSSGTQQPSDTMSAQPNNTTNGSLSEKVGGAMQSAGDKIKEGSVTGAISNAVSPVVDSAKDLHRRMKGEDDPLPEPEENLSDADVANMEDVAADTVKELEMDGLEDEHVEQLTDGRVDNVGDFEWDDAVYEDQWGEQTDDVHELDDFDAETVAGLKEEVKHEDYDSAVDYQKQRLDLLQRSGGLVFDDNGNRTSLNDLSRDEIEDRRRDRMIANLKDSGARDEQVAQEDDVSAQKMETLDTEQLEGWEKNKSVGPHSKTSKQKGYSYASAVGDIAKRSVKAYGHVFKNYSGTAAWRAGADQMRRSPYLSSSSGIPADVSAADQGQTGERQAVNAGVISADDLPDFDEQIFDDDIQQQFVEGSEGVTSEEGGERFNLQESDSGEYVYRPENSRRGGKKTAEARRRAETFDESPWDPANHGHGSNGPGNTMIVDNGDEKQIMEIGYIDSPDGDRTEAVRYYNPDEGEQPHLEPKKFQSATNVGVREYPHDDQAFTDNGIPYKSLHGSRHSEPQSKAHEYTQIQLDKHTELN